jgi:phage terminase small subunit
MATDPAQLLPRQQAFIDAYLADPNRNARAAAIAAGYSKRSAHSTAYTLLRDPRVRRAIDRTERPHRRRYGLTAKRVLREVATIAFSDVADYRLRRGQLAVAKTAEPRASRAVASVKRKTRYVKNADGSFEPEHTLEYRLWDKPKALGLAMKHLGLLVDRVEVTKREPQTWVVGGRTIII